MKCRTLIWLLPITIIVSSCCNIKNRNREFTEQYFNKIKREGDNAKLTMFFAQMPKGGDLHHHYSGSLYAETYLDWAASKREFIDSRTYGLSQLDTCKFDITIDSLKSNTELYRKVLEEWSDEDYSNNFHIQAAPDQHFFNTFSFFIPISGAYYRQGLAEIKQGAKTENAQYIETMFVPPFISVNFRKGMTDSLDYYQGKQDTMHLYQIFNRLEMAIKATPMYDVSIANYIDSMHRYHEGIDDSNFTMRFQTYGVRTWVPTDVFATLYSSFDAVARDKSSLLVGVNIVAPENNYVSMRDYWLHMQMFRYLKRKFPNVKTDMHAGELAMGMVKPQDLTYHIHDAVFIANTNRVGHGVDIPYETDAPELLKKMKSDSIAVEINLSSNEFILGVKDNDHPINLYYDAGVPIVISSDDMGVSRNNLTSQYVLLASRYHFTYSQIKSFVYNSIRYSFLSGREKASLIEKLNKQFDVFEAEIASDHGNNN